MSSNICGCGRAVLEVVNNAKAIEEINRTLKEKLGEEDLKKVSELFRRGFGIWIEDLHTECGMDEETVDKIFDKSKTDINEAIDMLRKELIKCAGMVG